jgi:hypothetical protein
MTCVIQNVETGTYLKHNCNFEIEQYSYDDVERQEDAERFSSLQHAFYAATWYADMFEKWRVIDTQTGISYVKGETGKFSREVTA